MTNLHAVSGQTETRRTVRMRDTAGQDRPVEPKPGRRYALPLAGLVVAGLLLAILAPQAKRWFSAERSVSADRLRTAVVDRGDFVRDISVQGEIVAAVSPTVFATEHGESNNWKR